MPSLAAVMMREGSTASEAVRNAAMGPTESEIAALAYLLWQINGCPVGSDKEDWFLAEAILKNALVAKGQDLSGRPTVPCGDTRTEVEMSAEFQWEGHWVIWESEWGGARWIRDLPTPGVEVPNRSMAIT
jgi:hypothetical protein